MNDEKLLEFLKGYAEFLRMDVDLSFLFPLTKQVSMAGGSVRILDKDGGHVGSICLSAEPTTPSMPIGPASLRMADLFVNLANAYIKFLNERKD